MPRAGITKFLKNVSEAGKTRQKRSKKRNLRAVNEHSEAVFNAVLPTQVVFQQPGGA
ncbi:phospholipid-binding lipoprotein MlaA [Pseudomonas sp. NFACC19-2]|nr:phospholipid-binding lipoprotein MlaA [Pseudomonas sp. NFACC19-2]